MGVLNLYGAKWIFRRSPFLQEFFDKKIDAEYEKKQGFMSVFVKLELARVLHHVIEAKGKNPKQYPDWEDEEE
ncbi:MAG: hypothetical protein HOD92_08390 [Deltaproteobacteria bacterium]|nr:hypothetical protein [Deltaproteobacteria bacterium]